MVQSNLHSSDWKAPPFLIHPFLERITRKLAVATLSTYRVLGLFALIFLLQMLFGSFGHFISAVDPLPPYSEPCIHIADKLCAPWKSIAPSVVMGIFSRNKIEGKTGRLLAWPGRDQIDPRVSFSFDIHSGPEVAFYQKNGSSIHEMPIDAVYKREAWYVGVAYNPWKIVNNFPEAAQQRLAHWAVYIRPCSSSDKVCSATWIC